MSKKIKMVEGTEKCPCGSGKKYQECCLPTQVRYFRDESDRIIKFNLDCAPSGSPSPNSQEPSECNHDCEHCDKHDKHEPVMAILAKEDGIFTHVDIDQFSVHDIKHLIPHLAVLQAKLTRTLVGKPQRDPLQEVFPILVVHQDENGELSYGNPDNFDDLSMDTIYMAIAALESQKLEFTLILFHIGQMRGSSSLIDALDEDEEDEDPEEI